MFRPDSIAGIHEIHLENEYVTIVSDDKNEYWKVAWLFVNGQNITFLSQNTSGLPWKLP